MKRLVTNKNKMLIAAGLLLLAFIGSFTFMYFSGLSRSTENA